SASGPSAGQGLVGSIRTPSESEEQDDTSAQPAANSPTALSWARYVIGLDQAIESIRNQADERLLQEEQPAEALVPDTTLLDPDDAARQTGTTPFLEPAVGGASRRFEAEKDRLEAIDVAIGSWGREAPASSQSLLPITPGTKVTESSTPVPRFVELEDRANLFPH